MLATESNIMWTESEIPIGADVHLYIGGNDQPEEIDGQPMVFRAMLGGVPTRRKIYHMDGDNPIAGLEGFSEDALFSPVSVYSPSDVPADANYAVFEKGKRKLDHYKDNRTCPFRAAKGYDGGLFISHQFPFRSYYPAGIPVLECKMRMLSQYPDDELIKSIKKYRSDLARFHKLQSDGRFSLGIGQFSSDIEHMQNKMMEMMEVLARRYRHSPGELIRKMEDIECEYLVEAQLDEEVQLVPIQ